MITWWLCAQCSWLIECRSRLHTYTTGIAAGTACIANVRRMSIEPEILRCYWSAIFTRMTSWAWRRLLEKNTRDGESSRQIRKHPKKDVNWNNNFSVGPSDWGKKLPWLTLLNKCYNSILWLIRRTLAKPGPSGHLLMRLTVENKRAAFY